MTEFPGIVSGAKQITGTKLTLSSTLEWLLLSDVPH